MCRRRENEYEMLERFSNETPARFVDLKMWPRRESVRRPLTYSEWFDWGQLFVKGAEENLIDVAQLFSSESMCVSAISLWPSDQILRTVRVIRIAPEKLTDVFVEAVWNKD